MFSGLGPLTDDAARVPVDFGMLQVGDVLLDHPAIEHLQNEEFRPVGHLVQ
ncbi:MAG TPA: hypothetical protein VLA12_15860 [Planctomycetaceae bacterium]|nr:hypothetical protein [Planctomycetaceae bacterium]